MTEKEPTTPSGVATTKWLLHKLTKGEMTAEEFVKLSKEADKTKREQPFDTGDKS